MEIKLIAFLVLVPGAFIWLPLLGYVCHRQDEKKREARIKVLTQEGEEYVKFEKLRPLYRLLVTTKRGTQYDSSPFEPKYELWGSRDIFKTTSEEMARIESRKIVERGYYVHRSNTVVPLHEIERIEVVK